MTPEHADAETRAKLIDTLRWLEQCEDFMRELTTAARGYDALDVETLASRYDEEDPTRWTYRNTDRLMRGLRSNAQNVRQVLANMAELDPIPSAQKSAGERAAALHLRVVEGGRHTRASGVLVSLPVGGGLK